jgi:hypothetical protein
MPQPGKRSLDLIGLVECCGRALRRQPLQARVLQAAVQEYLSEDTRWVQVKGAAQTILRQCRLCFRAHRNPIRKPQTETPLQAEHELDPAQAVQARLLFQAAVQVQSRQAAAGVKLRRHGPDQVDPAEVRAQAALLADEAFQVATFLP